MKVRELIAESIFTAGSARDRPETPRVTVILPTFRRGDSGMLARAIDSLLTQSFSDFELIAVDDASTDSTAGVLAQAMVRDPRVSVIRHRENIGLPAISEYEAYVRARGELIAFAFDDTVFYEHALRELVRESEQHPQSLITGSVNAFFRSPDDGALLSHVLGAGVDESDLFTRNVIPNNGVLAPRAILEEVGLYDPHIALARLCDYDLWLRVRRRFPIRFLDLCIGEEHGPTTTDSLGVTYPLDPWASDDRMRQRRDHLLTPARFAELDVFDLTAFTSVRSQQAVATLVEKHRETHGWMTPPAQATAGGQVPRILVLARAIDASIQFAFEGLRDVPGLHVRIVDPATRPVTEVADADVLIVSGQLHNETHWTDAARAADVPAFYFLDEDGPLDRLLADVEHLDGVLTSTEALAASARERGLHPSVTALAFAMPGVVADWRSHERSESVLPTIALLVGRHEPPTVGPVLWTALVEASQQSERRVRLVVPAGMIEQLERMPGSDRVEIVPVTPTADFYVTLRTLHHLGTDVLVEATDAEFTSAHALLSAAALGAELLTPATISDLTTAFREAIAAVAGASRANRSVAPDLFKTRFDPVVAAETLLTAIGPALSNREPDNAVRRHRVSDWLAVRLAESVASGLPTSTSARETAAQVAELRSALRRERRRLSPSLTEVPYLSYRMTIAPGGYRQVRALVWADGDAGDEIGVEIVDPEGRILLHRLAVLPRDDHPVTVTFDARQLRVDLAVPHEVRLFARTSRLAFVVEKAGRGRLMRRRAQPIVSFER